MAIFHKAALMAAAVALSGCATTNGGPHEHGMSDGRMAGAEGHEMRGPMMGMSPLVGCHGAHGDVDARLAARYRRHTFSSPMRSERIAAAA